MQQGKLIVIEAGDGAGKATQTNLLYERFKRENLSVRKVSFPVYDSPAAGAIKMYLSGEFGQKVNDVSAYAAATFYAVDRYASFKKDWESFYRNGGIVLADRYVTSNMAHQAVKIADENERREFLRWLEDLEYNRLALPRTDLVLFLDMEPTAAQKLRERRAEKIAGDIHEHDETYLTGCYAAYRELATTYKWQVVTCSVAGEPLAPEEIHAAVYKIAKKAVGTNHD